MFGHATLYMAVSIGNLIVFIRVWFLDTPPGGSQGDGIQLVLTLLSAIGLVNVSLRIALLGRTETDVNV